MTRQAFDVRALLDSVADFRATQRPLVEIFTEVGANEVSDSDIETAVRVALREEPDLVDAWQRYSYDKRSTPSPYLDGVEVGHYAAGKQHVRKHASPIDACADFVLAEVRWVINQRIIEPS